jgi:7-keto-8-aminopelargonate synthetase-like enzyme
MFRHSVHACLCMHLGFAVNIQSVSAISRTIVVPQDYSIISDAVNHASSGDTVLVNSGVYH